MQRLVRLLALLCATLLACGAMAAEPETETLLEGLHHPAGVAVQPETGQVFVSESGALRVIRIVDGKPQDVITGFTKDTYGDDHKIDVGPLGLAFLDKDTLVVGGGGQPAGDDELLIYTVPKPGEAALAADKPKLSFKLAAAGDVPGEGDFYSVVAARSGLFATTRGDSAKGWIAKADVRGTKVEEFRRFLATKTGEGMGLPGAIGISPRGDLVVGRISDGVLSFYSVKDGQHLATYTTGLKNISGLAYSASGQLYALNFSASADGEGGLFQIVGQGNAAEAKAKKIIALEHPSALAFAADGSLYITVFGTLKESDKATGSLLQIKPGL